MTITDATTTLTEATITIFTSKMEAYSHKCCYKDLAWSADAAALVVCDENGIVAGFDFYSLPAADRERLVQIATGCLVANGTRI